MKFFKNRNRFLCLWLMFIHAFLLKEKTFLHIWLCVQPFTGTVSRAVLGFWWHKRIDLGLKKRRAWFLIFRCYSEFAEPFTYFFPLTRVIKSQIRETVLLNFLFRKVKKTRLYLRDSAVKVEDVALCLVVPDGGLVLQLQQPVQVLALVLLCAGSMDVAKRISGLYERCNGLYHFYCSKQPIQVLVLVLICAVREHGCSESN